MRKPLEIRDFLRYQYLSDVQMNPSGTKAVFTVSTSDTKENTFFVTEGEHSLLKTSS